ncbi:glycosyl hydrolase [Streptomyces sp. NBRC 109706]|uniref:glycosyl hydrolase n=1 Tax=Streptomyces sp. NBRC 109706 TaxID=1550035 RepID=UPI00131E2FD5|nr:glycosyl hydrolase [Streptomyces sp. NBRC 109706]
MAVPVAVLAAVSAYVLSPATAEQPTERFDGAEPAPASAFPGYVQLAAKHSEKCLTVTEGTRDDPGAVVQSACSGSAEQQFVVEPTGNGSGARLISRASGLCLDVSEGSRKNRAALVHASCDDDPDTFAFRTLDAFAWLIDERSDKCVDVAAHRREDHARVIQFDCHDGANQRFAITRVEEIPENEETPDEPADEPAPPVEETTPTEEPAEPGEPPAEPDPVPPVESGVVPFRGVANSECGDMERMGVSWFYNWGLDPGGCGDRGFVPMISGKSHRSPEAVRGAVDQVAAAGYDTVLGFNEPNKADQADLSVAEAVALWPALTSNENVLVGSPATSADSGGRQWFSDFMAEVEAGNLRVDFINVHWYGWNADSCDARAAEFERYLNWVESKARGRPVWVTEYGCMHQSNPDEATVIDFYTASLEVLAERPWITRYAWYPWNPHNHLVADDGSLTALGTTYTRQPTHR